MHYLYTEDVIIAQCTSGGIGSINVIRMSGKCLKGIYKKITKTKTHPIPNTIIQKNIYINNHLLDRCLISYFMGPSSFTGEDVIEINCHGGEFVAQNIITKICNKKIARPALPGEFTFRSYSNGKIDLIQAESINDLINSETDVFANKSMENLGGRLSNEIKGIKRDILKITSKIEYELDLNEDDSQNNNFLYEEIKSTIHRLEKINSSTLFSSIINRGLRVVLVGKPNAGKSSLFNHLLGYGRSIVSETPGTTRDTVEAVFELSGYRVKIIDTAGYWESKNRLEMMGIKKTKNELLEADIVLFLGEKKSDLDLLQSLVKKNISIKILSKSDINKSNGYDVSICTLNGDGIKDLLTLLLTKIHVVMGTKDINAKYYINRRQQNVINRLIGTGNEILFHIKKNISHDILADLLCAFIDILNEIINPINKEDIINEIFSGFCVGK
jgi:tRNA modification GTPase